MRSGCDTMRWELAGWMILQVVNGAFYPHIKGHAHRHLGKIFGDTMMACLKGECLGVCGSFWLPFRFFMKSFKTLVFFNVASDF